MKVPEAVTHEHSSHRLRYHHSKGKREENEAERSRALKRHVTQSSLLLLVRARSRRAKLRNWFMNRMMVRRNPSS